MFEREMDERRRIHWLERYEQLGKEISCLVSARTEMDAAKSLDLLLSGFGGSSSAVNFLKATNV